MWNPCEWLTNHCDVIYHPSPEIEKLCTTVNDDICQHERFDQANRFLHELLLALFKTKLPIRLAEDFVFVGLYVEQGDCDVQVKKQLPAAVRKVFMKKGWLPKTTK